MGEERIILKWRKDLKRRGLRNNHAIKIAHMSWALSCLVLKCNTMRSTWVVNTQWWVVNTLVCSKDLLVEVQG